MNREPINKYVQIAVVQRDGYQCRYCGDLEGPFEFDHVYPISRGGINEGNNIIIACKRCNREKSDAIGGRWWPPPIGYFSEPEKVEKRNILKLLGDFVSYVFWKIALWFDWVYSKDVHEDWDSQGVSTMWAAFLPIILLVVVPIIGSTITPIVGWITLFGSIAFFAFAKFKVHEQRETIRRKIVADKNEIPRRISV